MHASHACGRTGAGWCLLLHCESLASYAESLASVQDGDDFGSPHLGTGTVDIIELLENDNKFEGWLKLRGRTGRQQSMGKARLHVKVAFVPVMQVHFQSESFPPP